MYTYCNLEQAKNELKATSTINDDLLLQYIITSSTRMNMYVQSNLYYSEPYFLPYRGIKKIRMTSDNVSSQINVLDMGVPMLQLTSVAIEGTDVSSNVRAYPHDTISPFWKLEMKKTSSWWRYCSSSTNAYPSAYAVVTGVWGWHGDYANAWLDVDTVQNVGGISSSATTLIVADVDGSNEYGFAPRISVADYIRLGDEIMWVVATNTTTNVVTVKRAVLGTTASAHAQGTSVRVYQQMPEIVRVASRQTAFTYARQGSFQTQTLDGVGVISMPVDLLTELKAVLYRFMVK